MARQNYQHGKRQRELAKKQKQDEKVQRRLERKNNPQSDDPNAPAEPEDGLVPVEGEESDAPAEESEGTEGEP